MFLQLDLGSCQDFIETDILTLIYLSLSVYIYTLDPEGKVASRSGIRSVWMLLEQMSAAIKVNQWNE